MTEPVLDLLNSKGVFFIPSGKDYLIKCLNPNHEDSNPSCRVDRQTGVTHCFACGFKTNLFKHFGILGAIRSIRVVKLKAKIKELRQSYIDIELPKGHTPYTRPFRGISTKTLRKFGAYYTHEEPVLEDRVCFPISDIRGKLVASVARHAMSDGNPRYVVYPGERTLPLYPNILPSNTVNLVVVEGIFDMLNLVDKGMDNVACVFGTSTLKSDTKNKLLPFKAQGIEKVFILFDGDEAGRTAALEIKPLLEAEDFEVEIIDLPDGTDPGNLTQEDVDSLIEYTL